MSLFFISEILKHLGFQWFVKKTLKRKLHLFFNVSIKCIPTPGSAWVCWVSSSLLLSLLWCPRPVEPHELFCPAATLLTKYMLKATDCCHFVKQLKVCLTCLTHMFPLSEIEAAHNPRGYIILACYVYSSEIYKLSNAAGKMSTRLPLVLDKTRWFSVN